MLQRRSIRAARDPSYIELVARLRVARRAARISQKALAEALGIQQALVSKVETGERRLDVIECLRWCEALGVPMSSVIPESLRGAL